MENQSPSENTSGQNPQQQLNKLKKKHMKMHTEKGKPHSKIKKIKYPWE